MLVGKARAYPRAAPFRCFTVGYAPGLTHLSLERLARDKHSSLLQKLINYGQKGFIGLAPDSTFFSENSLKTFKKETRTIKEDIKFEVDLKTRQVQLGEFQLIISWANILNHERLFVLP